MIELEIKNLDKLQDSLKKYPVIAERWLQRAIEASIAEIQKNATRGVLPWRTGRLAQSFGEGIRLGRLWGKIGPTVNYAIFVHEGTRRGIKPNRFMNRIAEKASPAIQKHFSLALDKIVEEVAG
ncbi:MAG: HK97 gp10 family phage protein [Patescibacteria group bacterium]